MRPTSITAPTRRTIIAGPRGFRRSSAACWKVRAVSVRAADLFGPHVAESLAGARLFGPALAGKKVQLLANPDLPHSLTYIRDVGRAMVTLGENEAALGQAWHV